MKRLIQFILHLAVLGGLLFSVRAELITYTYDSAGRLTGASYGSGKSTSYAYDPAGNMTGNTDTVFTDSDNDGMDDSWELLHFETRDRDGTGDFDLDGLSDLEEFLAGTLPKDDQSGLRVSRNVTTTGSSTTIEWSSVPGKTYRVQYKNSLADAGWNDLPGDVTATGATVTKIDSTAAGTIHRYYRVQVVQ